MSQQADEAAKAAGIGHPGSDGAASDVPQRRVINPESRTIFDQKFSKQIKISKDYVAPINQKEASLEFLRKEIARRDEAKIKQYMKDVEAPPVSLPQDELTQRMLMSVSSEFDQKSLERISAGMNPKISQMMLDTIIAKENNQRMQRVWGPTISALRQGRLGVDLFFIVFAFIGIAAIPTYYLMKQQKVKDFMRKQGISPISVEDLQEPANKGIDLDDISVHANYYDLREYRENLEKRLKVTMEKNKLKEELYGDLQRQKDEYLFGASTSGSGKTAPHKPRA